MLTDKTFINITEELSKWSKCLSKKVWALIVKDGRILSTWYNWTPSWYINCNDYFWWVHTTWVHWKWSVKYEIHAEMNVILWAARKWVSIEWWTMYCSCQPCYDCTKNIIWAWIKKIVYKDKWKHNNSTELDDFLKDNWCISIQFNKNETE